MVFCALFQPSPLLQHISLPDAFLMPLHRVLNPARRLGYDFFNKNAIDQDDEMRLYGRKITPDLVDTEEALSSLWRLDSSAEEAAITGGERTWGTDGEATGARGFVTILSLDKALDYGFGYRDGLVEY